MKKFAPDSDEVTEETVRKFVTDYLDGNLKVGIVCLCSYVPWGEGILE